MSVTTGPLTRQQSTPRSELAREGPFGVFPSAQARAAMWSLYERKLALWPVPFHEVDVPGRFGTTHVVVAGDPAAPPLVLVHMTACPSFIWAPIIGPLAERFRVHAVDTIGDAGKSELTDPARHPRSGREYAAWLTETLDTLELGTVDLVAGSHGGWIGMHCAAHAPERVRRLVLIVPMGLASWPHTLGVLGRMLAMAAGRSRAKTERMLSWLMGDDPAARALVGDWLTRVIEGRLALKLGNPLPVPASTRRAIRAPTLVILGERDPLVGNAMRAARRALRTIPAAQVEIIAGGTHATHLENPEQVVARTLAFLGAQAPATFAPAPLAQ